MQLELTADQEREIELALLQFPPKELKHLKRAASFENGGKPIKGYAFSRALSLDLVSTNSRKLRPDVYWMLHGDQPTIIDCRQIPS